MMNTRAGIFMQQPMGYKSFVPVPLPPEPPVIMDDEMIALLSNADRKLGRLDGITQILPNPDLFVSMYVKKEAVLSSQIEGTQASLIDVLDEDVNKPVTGTKYVEEVVRYVYAMNYGLVRLDSLPLSLRLLREIHKELLSAGRGSKKNPGEFRTTQNWIGPSNSTLATATFIPPTVDDMNKALADLEIFMYQDDNIPILIKIGMIHAQFETIHPFLDGNGRMGRLLITFWLCQQEILTKPLLYLSYYFKQHRTEYYDRLMDVRKKGDWESWLKFFLKGISEVSDEATDSAKEIIGLSTKYTKMLQEGGYNTNHQRLLDELFENPIITKNKVAEILEVSYPTANTLVEDFCNLGILKILHPEAKRNRKYEFSEYVTILNRGTELF